MEKEKLLQKLNIGTDEYADNKHFKDLPVEVQEKINNWIASKLKRSNEVCWKSSYGLKHILKRETGIYITNNQFKEAMLEADYKPENPDDINWYYKIAFQSIVENPSRFFELAVQYAEDASPEGDFARDMRNDSNFPTESNYRKIYNYLSRAGACPEALEAFTNIWDDYTGVEPGDWKMTENGNYICTKCDEFLPNVNYYEDETDVDEYVFCPSCGARMRFTI